LPGNPLPLYSFLPWSRRGIAAQIDQADHLGATPDAGPAGRATLTAELTVEAVAVPGAADPGPTAVSRTVSLVGPGDVQGLTPGTVLRSVPNPGTNDATPGELAFVEFYDEDFPWRYTPAKATATHRLRPWLALLVLEEGEYEVVERPGLPGIVTVADHAPLPPPTEAWAWAHVQMTGAVAADGSDLDALVGSTPDHSLSRLLSPRRLLAYRTYRAFVVPAFETGRLAGLGTADPAVPAQRPAWGSGQPRRFPVVHGWSFRTSKDASFETLALRPKAIVAGQSFGKRPLDVSDPGADLPVVRGATVPLEGALQPLRFARDPYPTVPGPALAAGLQALVDLTEDYREQGTMDDPIVTPPAYGRAPAGLQRVADTATVSGLDWVAELNNDPRNRAAAGLGAQIVQQRDEELMERAWTQVEALEAVNKRLREADLALTTTEQIFAKHVARGDTDRVLAVTATAHAAIAAEGAATLRGQIDASRVPAAAQAPAFRRMTRPLTNVVRTVTANQASTLSSGLVAGLNAEPGADGTVSAAPPAPDPAAGLPLDTVLEAAASAAAQQATQPVKPRERFLTVAYDELRARTSGPGGLVPIANGTPPTQALVDLRTALRARLFALIPAGATGEQARLRDGVEELIGSVLRLDVPRPASAVLPLVPAVFAKYFGDSVDGKSYQGVTACPAGSSLDDTASTANPASVQGYVDALGQLSDVSTARPPDPVADPLDKPDTIADALTRRLHPRATLPARLSTVLTGLDVDLTAAAVQARRLKPVLAYPTFDDPLFEPLRLISQDYVLPNLADLPPESIALMEPNTRFIESLMAGACTEMARDLLWNEYPTDQRGTYFARFWDPRDAGPANPAADITALHTWGGDLGTHAVRSGNLLVLVVRAALLVKFTDTIVFAQQARFVGSGPSRTRTLDDTGSVRYPVVTGHLEPDIRLYGFELTPDAAAGDDTDAGYFFCFMERPGQVRFGLDTADPPPPLTTWDALAWAHLSGGGGAMQVLVADNAALAPTTQGLPQWGATSAHMASILFQSPVLLARHASDMIPKPGTTPVGGPQ
jgi:hypothetical protein